MTSIYRDTRRPDVSSKIQRVGPFLLGPNLGNAPPAQCLKQYLARRELTQEFYTLKVLSLPERDLSKPEPLQEQQGRILLCTEHKLLSRLKGHKGIVQHRGFFKEVVRESVEVDGRLESRLVTKQCLVLDPSATPHDFGSSSHLANLQHYVLKNKKLPESEAISIFVNIVQIVERLHRENIIHRDLKLGNFTLNFETKEVILVNFGLAKELESETQLLKDQRGSPAYISPEVISGKAYLGKPSDMWALGITLYTMLFGQFPFEEKELPELFKKIKAAEFKIPGDVVIGSTSVNLIQSLLVLDPTKRLTASELLQKLKNYINLRYSKRSETYDDLQVVPTLTHKRSHESDAVSSLSPGDLGGPPSMKRSKVEFAIDLEQEAAVPEQNMFDLEEVLVANASQLEKDEADISNVLERSEVAEGGIQVAPPKRQRYAFTSTSGLRSIKISKVKDEPRVLTRADLERLYTIYTNKAKGRAPPVPSVRTAEGSAAIPESPMVVDSQARSQNVSDSSPSPVAPVARDLAAKRLRLFQHQQRNSQPSPSSQVIQ